MGLTAPLPVETRPEPMVWGKALACERGLLGALLEDAAIYDRIKDVVAPEDFSTGLHQRLFNAFEGADRSHGAIDGDLLVAELGAYAWDAEDGAVAYLDRLRAERVSAEQITPLARDIHLTAKLRRESPEPIDRDAVAWSQQQAALLTALAARSDDLARQVDWQNVIEEILHVGRSQTSGVVRKIELIFEHLLKTVSDPDAPSRFRWRVEIDAWRRRIAREGTPSMRRLIDLDSVWERGRSDAERDLADCGMRPSRDVPATCPFTFDELIIENLTTAQLLDKLVTSMNSKPSDPLRGNP